MSLLSIPTHLGRYRILGALEGARSTLYLSRDEDLGLDVTLKSLSPDLRNDDLLRHFLYREARILARLQHPNVVAHYEFGQHEGWPFLVLERLRGTSLRDALQVGISLQRSLSAVVQVLAGLAHVHAKGIIHRDVKPENITLEPDGTAKIKDFGIATWTDVGATTKATGDVVGTPDYMSPEQVIGAELDRRSDLFAVGSVLYELVTGRRPFHADNLMAIFYKITYEDADEALLPAGPNWERLRGVIRRSLRKDPDERFSDAEAMSAELALALEELGGGAERKAPPGLETPARVVLLTSRPATPPDVNEPHVSSRIRTRRSRLAEIVRRIKAIITGGRAG